MTSPVIPVDRKPTLLLRSRQGTFPSGNSEYVPFGEFRIEADANKATILTATLDNVPKVGGPRYLDALKLGDTILALLEDDYGTQHCLFNGIIQSLEFKSADVSARIRATDTAAFGVNAVLNEILHQKFTYDEEVAITESDGEVLTTLPADIDHRAPVTAETRVAYGNPISAEDNNIALMRGEAVYTSSDVDFALRGPGAPYNDYLALQWTYTEASAGSPSFFLHFGQTRVEEIIGVTIEGVPVPASEYTLNTDVFPNILQFNYTDSGGGYDPPWDNNDVVVIDYYTDNPAPKWGSTPEYTSIKGAKAIKAQTFLVSRSTNISNIFVPIAHQVMLYPGEDSPQDLNWTAAGVTPQVLDGAALATGDMVDSALFGQAYNRLGANNRLKITLVECFRASNSEGSGSATVGTVDVAQSELIPTATILSEESSTFTLSGTHLGTAAGTNQFQLAKVLTCADGSKAEIEISATNPIPAPHSPEGETIKMTHNWGHLHDEIGNEAYTLFGWNLEDNPVFVEAGTQVAMIFEELGYDHHPQLTDGVIPDNDDQIGYLTPNATWVIGMANNGAAGFNNIYEKGSFMMQALDDDTDEYYENQKGLHGGQMFNGAYGEVPGYNGNTTVGKWQYMDKYDVQRFYDINRTNELLNQAMTNYDVFSGDTTTVQDLGGIDLATVSETELFRGFYPLHSAYFMVIGSGWRRVGQNLYWVIDEHRNKLVWNGGSANWAPFTNNRYKINMGRLSYYTNPATGGLLDSSNASSVCDVFEKIVSKVDGWQATICDGDNSGINDIEGVGFNDPAIYPLSYYPLMEKSAWSALTELAIDNDAVVWINSDSDGNSTVVFEKATPITDFVYDSPGAREYTFSSLVEHPNWMKHIISTNIQHDTETMYSRFKVLGSQNAESQYNAVEMGINLPSSQPTPIMFVLEVPEIEEALGYAREFEFKAAKHITSHDIAYDAAKALQTIHAIDKYGGVVELAGLQPLYNHPTLGYMLDMNSIVRIIDDKTIAGPSTAGTGNVFRVVGIKYSSGEHKTDITLTTSGVSKELTDAQNFLDDLKKTASATEDTHLSRHISVSAPSATQRIINGVLTTIGFDAQPSDSYQMTVNDTDGMQGTVTAKTIPIDDDNWYIVGVFLPGTGTIANDASPLTASWVQTNRSGSHSTMSSIGYFESSVYKYPNDTLTVIAKMSRNS